MDVNTSVTTLSQLLDNQAAAVCNRDITAATSNYASDVVIFDVVGPLQHPTGDASVRKRLEDWFNTFAPGVPILFEIADRVIGAEEHLGFTHSLNHVHVGLKNGAMLDMFWRETLNWRKIDGRWKIVHAHSSVPFDPATGMASTGLKPDDGQGT
jgi:ketosteroid isomerase-like protein